MKVIIISLLLQVSLIMAMPWLGHESKSFVAKKQVLSPFPREIQAGDKEFYLSHSLLWQINSVEKELHEGVLGKFNTFHTKRAEVSHPNLIHSAQINTKGHFVTPDKPEDEEYELIIEEGQLTINAETQNGVALAMTSLIQLIETEEHQNGDILYKIPNYPLRLKDSPAFSYRGLLVDTSRHYFDVAAIKTVIDWISDAKLNTLHLHLTDVQSWPVEIDMYPEFTENGAYSLNKTYSRAQIAEIVKYGKTAGVNIIPEIDCPAHAPINFGTKAFQDKFNGSLVQCTQLEYDNPNYSAEMPTGQWNMTNPSTHEVLENVWDQLSKDFTSDIIHMGMDELNQNCACVDTVAENGTAAECKEYVTGVFQEFAKDIVTSVQEKQNKTVLVWQDSLFEYNVSLPNPSNTIVQIWNWDPSNQKQVEKMTSMCKEGYKFIYSQYSTYYLDCGGTNSCLASLTWCPYVTWYDIYTQSITQVPDECKDNIIGAEGAMWSEVITQDTMAAKLLPRIWAIGERTWSNPATATKAASLEGAKIWMDYLPTIREKTEQYINWGIGVRPVNTEYCSVNEEQGKICNNWTMQFYETLCDMSEGKVTDADGNCVQCGNGTFAMKAGLGCLSCDSTNLGNCHCCNEDGTLGECPTGCNCSGSGFCSEYK